MKRILELSWMAVLLGVVLLSCNEKKSVKVDVDFGGERKAISPYIFGVNTGVKLEDVSVNSIRQGGNRMTAYNWETNKSSAGSDWHNSSDDYLINNVPADLKKKPAAVALDFSNTAAKFNISYTLYTLQMAGYVANSDGEMTKENALDGKDWCKVVNRKPGAFLMEPDVSDSVVYTDELLNYLGNTIGKSDSATGFKAYSLDNEPALWEHTHSLIQRNKITAAELITKTVDLASTIKDFDSNAEVFGPALFGYSSFCSLGTDFPLIQAESAFKYRWFIDYYLEKMKEAEEQQGRRILDVLDLHYYTEAKGACGKRGCTYTDNDDCIKARMDAVRSLWDNFYKERSWITDSGAQWLPLLPKVCGSIKKFYPGTKLAVTEYNFNGGDHISGAIAQTDFLSVLCEYEVYFASLWAIGKNEYQLAAINMFTNYDGNKSTFGDSLIPSKSGDDYTVYSCAAENSEDGKIHIILTNKEIHNKTSVVINLNNVDSSRNFSKAELYVLDGSGTQIRKSEKKIKFSNNTLTLTLDPLTVNHLILN